MLTTQQIQQTVADYFKDKPVKRVYLFGSYARGDAREDSDVDLLVDLEKGVGWQIFSWPDELQQLMAVPTDVVSNADKPEHTSNWKLIERINKEKLLLYEKA